MHHPIADICALRIVPNELIAPELSSRFFHILSLILAQVLHQETINLHALAFQMDLEFMETLVP